MPPTSPGRRLSSTAACSATCNGPTELCAAGIPGRWSCGGSDDRRRIAERGGLVGVEPDPDRGDLAADGLAGDDDRPLGRVQHERWARVDLHEAYGGPLVRAGSGLERDQ